jgi:hypothetical protein
VDLGAALDLAVAATDLEPFHGPGKGRGGSATAVTSWPRPLRSAQLWRSRWPHAADTPAGLALGSYDIRGPIWATWPSGDGALSPNHRAAVYEAIRACRVARVVAGPGQHLDQADQLAM